MRFLAAFLACCLLAWPLQLWAKPSQSRAERQASLEKLWRQLDKNRDGELDAPETEAFVTASLDPHQEGWSIQAATQASREALDGPDAGVTVNKAELAAHLGALLQDHQVEDWVTHGLNLPQYAPAFRHAAITALDFPFLVSDGGTSLRQDLGVASKLHQLQILRGLKRLILGLGQLPSPPSQLDCAAANKSAVLLTWQPPAATGHPAFHKFVLQRQRLRTNSAAKGSSGEADGAPVGGHGSHFDSGGSASSGSANQEPWEMVGEPDDEDCSWVDFPPARGGYRYRLTAWSAYGRSPYAVSRSVCSIRAPVRPPAVAQPQPLGPAELQALLAAVAASSNLSGAIATASHSSGGGVTGGVLGSGGSGVWSWSAASSAAIVALTILVKASQLRVGGVARLLWRRLGSMLWRAEGNGDNTGLLAAAGGERMERQPSLEGMRSGHSSIAALTGLQGGEQLAADGQAAQALLLKAGGWSWNGSSSAPRPAQPADLSRSSTGLQQQPPGWDATSGAAVAELYSEANEQVQQAVQRGLHCAHAGCHRRFDRLRDLRRKLESHYCGLCQRTFCLQHTRVSPHGPRGGCGLESQCICHACFAEMAPAQQAACDRGNRLPKPPSAVHAAPAPAAAAAAAGGRAEAAAGGRAEAAEQQPGDGDADFGRLSSPDQPGSVAAGTAGPGSTPLLQQAIDDSSGAAIGGGGATSLARKRWRKAGAALRALVRFRDGISRPAEPHRQ